MLFLHNESVYNTVNLVGDKQPLKRYDRYVLAQLMQTFGFFCLILAMAYWINRALGIFSSLIGDGQSSFVFFELILLFLPQVIAIVLPVAAISATIVVINRLTSDNELIIFDSAGLKPSSFLRPFFYFAILCGVTTAILSLYLVPTSRAQLEFRKEEISKDIVSRLITDGSFLHPIKNMTIFVSSVSPQGELEDIFIHDQRSKERVLTYIATKAVLVKEKEENHLVLFNGLIQTLDIKSQTLSHVGFESLAYEITNLAASKSKQLMNVDNYGIIDLLTADKKLLRILKKNKASVRFEAHDRILKPLQCIFYILLTSVIMFIGGHSRFGLAQQIFLSIGSVLVFNILCTNGLTLIRKDSSNWFLPYLCLIAGIIIMYFLFVRLRQPFKIRQPKKTVLGNDL